MESKRKNICKTLIYKYFHRSIVEMAKSKPAPSSYPERYAIGLHYTPKKEKFKTKFQIKYDILAQPKSEIVLKFDTCT